MTQKNDISLSKVPVKQRTADTCLNAVKKDGRELKYVPKKLKTAEICLAAVQNDGSALKFVPRHLRTTELQTAALHVKIYFNEQTPENLKCKVEEIFNFTSQEVE